MQKTAGTIRHSEGGHCHSPAYWDFCLLSSRPLVIRVKDYVFSAPWNHPARRLLEVCRWRHAQVLVNLTWCYEDRKRAVKLARRLSQPGWRGNTYHVLANSEQEVDVFHSLGLHAIHCNHNAFLSEQVFYPNGTGKKYDAIYDAAMIPFKRHELASHVDNLALISYLKIDTPRDVARSIINRLGHAVLLNDFENPEQNWLDSDQVNVFLNQARVGLALSAVEGAMYASGQYLLAGLPVVTTHNRGGRDSFFHTDYVRWVEADPVAVATAVAELSEQALDPFFIRNRVLALMAGHRERFVNLMNEIISASEPGSVWSSGWPANMPNKLDGGMHLRLPALLKILLDIPCRELTTLSRIDEQTS